MVISGMLLAKPTPKIKLRNIREFYSRGAIRTLEITEEDGEDGGDEGHRQEDDGDDREDHNCLPLLPGQGGLVSGEARFDSVGVSRGLVSMRELI